MADEYSRPNPDELLARIKSEDGQKKRGRLKIFLGYAPGVGKTYTMLEEARLRKKGTDVVVAVVDTHGRADTEALLEGFEVLPRRREEHRDIELTEMDLDALLKRHPQLALVDELAHQNPPGSRHNKRYQDVQEILEAGIDVYTTLNIQHLESGRNIVAQITGVWVRETVPDSFVDSADEVELVDLPPDELITRLKEGKVYVPDQIAQAIEKFFRKSNLAGLRELVMRTAAKHVDEQTLADMRSQGVAGSWPSGEHLLLYIGPDSHGSRLVRSARRLARELGAEWTALHVETASRKPQSPAEQQQISDSLQLAQRLGAKIVAVQGDSIPSSVIGYAQTHNITKIVAAKPLSNLMRLVLGRSIVDRIIQRSEYIEVHLVGPAGEPVENELIPGRIRAPHNRYGYLWGLLLVTAATLLGQLLHGVFAPTTISMLYLLCVVIVAYAYGRGPAIITSLMGVLAFDFFHVPPYLSFSVSDTQYIFTFLALLAVGLVISQLAESVRRQTEIARQSERRMAALYALGRELATSSDLNSYIMAITRRLKETFGHDAEVFLPDPQNRESLKPYTGDSKLPITENDIAAAVWSFRHVRKAGPGTDTLPNARARYQPLVTARGMVGVLALVMNPDDAGLRTEQEHLLDAYADLAAVALESILVAEEARSAEVLRSTEKLQSALLNAASHDLRTPLVSIIGALSSLQERGMNLDDTAKNNLIGVAREEAERLNHMITNLLDVSRIEAGAITVSRQPWDVSELFGAAMEQLGGRTEGRSIKIELPDDMPMVLIDFGLSVQILVNVLDNALKYSPPDSPIEITGRPIGGEAVIEIADRGVGIPPQDLVRVFDKFYRIERPGAVGGTGLGLSICKGMIDAQGGRIDAENRPGGGTILRIVLPLSGEGKNS